MPETPIRVQRKRTRGWRMPENTVYVGRPSKWGNHIHVAPNKMTAPHAVNLFRAWVNERAGLGYFESVRAELRGKNLACWCPLDQPCHADVLLELANGDPNA